MIHTVHLDDEHVDSREFLKEIHLYKNNVRFENPFIGGVAPEGYVTSKEFKKLAIAKVNKFCNEQYICQ